MKTSIPLILGVLASAVNHSAAAPLSEGEFTRVINDVKILPLEASPVPAKTGDRISGRTAVSTGAQSRAELRFSDNTLTRLGANSVFRMDQSTRTVEMEKGVVLLQVPKQLGGAKVRTAAVTAAVTGTTILLEFTPDGFVKIIVVEGEVDVSLNEHRNQFRTLVAGDMWITRANDKSGLPLPVQVDLERLKKTSKLMDTKEFPPLGNQKYVDGALKDQSKKKLNGELANTSFQIEGRGRNVTLLTGDHQHIPVTNKPTTKPPVTEPGKPTNLAGSTVFDNLSSIDTYHQSNAYNSAVGAFTLLTGSEYSPHQDGPFGSYMFDNPLAFTGLDDSLEKSNSWFVLKGDEIYISGSPSLDNTQGPKDLILGATGDINFTANPPFVGAGLATGDLWALGDSNGSFVFPSLAGSINFDGFNLTGTKQDVIFYADGASSDVNISGITPALISLPKGTFQAVAGRDINVSGASVKAREVTLSVGRNLNLGNETSGAAKLSASKSITLRAQQKIKITNSSQLLSLSKIANTKVLMEAVNGNVELADGSSVEAGAVDMTSQRGDVQLMNSTISAREIKARVYDSGGTLLVSNAILGHGTNASDLIRLYGEGSGGIRFVGNTILRGKTVDLAGSIVSIDPGSRVQLSNPSGTTVYADTHAYNNGTNGNFTGLSNDQSGGSPTVVNQQPFSKRPGY